MGERELRVHAFYAALKLRENHTNLQVRQIAVIADQIYDYYIGCGRYQ